MENRPLFGEDVVILKFKVLVWYFGEWTVNVYEFMEYLNMEEVQII